MPRVVEVEMFSVYPYNTLPQCSIETSIFRWRRSFLSNFQWRGTPLAFWKSLEAKLCGFPMERLHWQNFPMEHLHWHYFCYFVFDCKFQWRDFFPNFSMERVWILGFFDRRTLIFNGEGLYCRLFWPEDPYRIIFNGESPVRTFSSWPIFQRRPPPPLRRPSARSTEGGCPAYLTLPKHVTGSRCRVWNIFVSRKGNKK